MYSLRAGATLSEGKVINHNLLRLRLAVTDAVDRGYFIHCSLWANILCQKLVVSIPDAIL